LAFSLPPEFDVTVLIVNLNHSTVLDIRMIEKTRQERLILPVTAQLPASF